VKHQDTHCHQVRIKADVFHRDGGVCHYCGRNLSLAYYPNGVKFPDSATVDHLLEKSKGGKFVPDNLVCCCDHCNRKRNNLGMTPEEFRQWRMRHPFGALLKGN
jgi:5-methylcytosine-specific restriction endonuclease McrA